MTQGDNPVMLKGNDELINPYKSGLGFLISVIIGILLFLISRGHIPLAGSKALAITGFAIAMWLLQVLPVEITSILVSVLFCLFGAAPPKISFGGFAEPSVWFVFAALIYGVAIHASGIGKRIAVNIMKFTSSSFAATMAGILFTGLVLSFVTPAGVERLVILFSIAIGLAAAFGMSDDEFKKSNVSKVTMGIVYLGANCFGYGIMTAMAPNVVGIGIIKNLLGVSVSWAQWLVWFGLPCAVSTVITAALLFVMFKPEPLSSSETASYIVSEKKKLGAFSVNEKKATLYLVISLILWATNNINHLPPWGVAVLIGMLFVAPGIGIIGPEDVKRLPVSVVIFTGAVLSIGETLLHTGVASWLGKFLLGSVIAKGMSASHMGMWTFLAGVVSHIPLVEGMTMVSAFVPVVAHYFHTLGVNALGPTLVAIMASDNIGYFPAMQLPMLLLVGLGYLSYKDSIKILCLYSGVAILIQILASFTWYHWMGLL